MNPTPNQIPFSVRVQERIAQSRFLTFSLLLHVIIVIIGGGTVLFHRPQPPEDFAAPGELVKADEPQVESDPIVQAAHDSESPPNQEAIASPPTHDAITANLLMTRPKLELAQAAARMPGILAQIDAATVRNPASKISGVFAARFGGALRKAAAMKTGGTDKSEKAVIAGLRWLKEHQNPDGSWSDEFKPAMTGLALLGFLGHGELPVSPEFGPTVKRALDWVLARGEEFDGRMSLTKDGWGGNSGVYEHAILTYAMSEYYGMTKDERFEPVLKQAIGYIVAGQTPVGGWDYGYAKGPRNDLSVAGWQIQALKAAHLTGLGIPGVDEALDKAMPFLKSWQGNEGGFGYDKPANRVSLTGVGVLCTYFWKEAKDRTVKEGIDFLLGKAEVKYKGGKSPADLYAWYYDTQACLMFGGSAWEKWNRLFQNEIVGNQSPDGSWPATAGGAGEMQSKPTGAGPFYRTTLCVLMLESFYRYVPIK